MISVDRTTRVRLIVIGDDDTTELDDFSRSDRPRKIDGISCNYYSCRNFDEYLTMTLGFIFRRSIDGVVALWVVDLRVAIFWSIHVLHHGGKICFSPVGLALLLH